MIARAITRSIVRPISANRKKCYALNFNGINTYAQLAERAIDPDGDNVFEFWTPNVLRNFDTIISQNSTGVFARREFQLFTSSFELRLNLGGTDTALLATSQGLKTNTKYKLTLIGNQATVYDANGNVLRTTAFTRGAEREPLALTKIGANTDSGGHANYFQGQLPYIRINNYYYTFDAKGQAIQLPVPSGLGAELITQSVLENPAIQGSQWTYLGDGRWQYVGDGSNNTLSFLAASNQPDSGFLEFEVESISGTMRCAQNAPSNPVNPRFSTVGIRRYFYSQKSSAAGSTGNTVVFIRDVGAASCIIKNISFKPLGTSNPATIYNAVPEQWDQIPCNLRPPAPQQTDGFLDNGFLFNNSELFNSGELYA